MKLPTAAGRPSVGINMTPMIDVVFQLIIFFLLSSHLARQESHLPLPLPAASSGQRDGDQAARMVVNVRADGTLSVAGQTLSVEQLQAALERRREAAGQDLQLRIRSHREVAYRFVEPVMLTAARAGIWNIHFAVVRRSGE
jgi:biopolymer transport protein ExbD